jgi:hypothetical protein
VQSLFRRRGKAPERRIAAVEDVPVGGAVLFEYPIEQEEDPCVLVRLDGSDSWPSATNART